MHAQAQAQERAHKHHAAYTQGKKGVGKGLPVEIGDDVGVLRRLPDFDFGGAELGAELGAVGVLQRHLLHRQPLAVRIVRQEHLTTSAASTP